MLNPGVYPVCDFTITQNTALEGSVSDEIGDMEGIVGLTLSMRFAFGAGGGSGAAYLQTSFDQGTTWVDIACFTFTTASKHRVVNLSAMTPRTAAGMTPQDGSLTDDTCEDGMLGDRFRVKLKTTGTAYSGSTTLSGRITVK